MRAQNRFRILSLSCLFIGALSLVVFAEESVDSASDNEKIANSSTGADAGAADPDGGIAADAGPEPEPEPVVAAAPPPDPPEPEIDESQFPDAAQESDNLPYAKGDMEAGIGLGLAGDGKETYLGVGGSFAYYVINRLATGLSVQYTHIFVDSSLEYEYPQSMVIMPFAKFVITRKNVAPYVIATVGYEIEWGTSHAVNAWILGFGGGVHIRVAKRFSINLELTALHYWYDDTKIYWYKDSDVYTEAESGVHVVCHDPAHCPELAENEPLPEGSIELKKDEARHHCPDPANCPVIDGDKKDRDREWFFPLISIGFSVFF